MRAKNPILKESLNNPLSFGLTPNMTLHTFHNVHADPTSSMGDAEAACKGNDVQGLGSLGES